MCAVSEIEILSLQPPNITVSFVLWSADLAAGKDHKGGSDEYQLRARSAAGLLLSKLKLLLAQHKADVFNHLWMQ